MTLQAIQFQYGLEFLRLIFWICTARYHDRRSVCQHEPVNPTRLPAAVGPRDVPREWAFIKQPNTDGDVNIRPTDQSCHHDVWNHLSHAIAQAASTPKLRNKECTNHQYMTKIFHFELKLGITTRYSSFSMEALKTQVEIRRMFISSSVKAATIFDQIIWRNWKSTRTRTTKKLRAFLISRRDWYWNIQMMLNFCENGHPVCRGSSALETKSFDKEMENCL